MRRTPGVRCGIGSDSVTDTTTLETKMTSIDTIENERGFFLALARAGEDASIRRELLEKMTRKQVTAVSLLALNLLFGTFGVSSAKKKALRPLKPFLRSVSEDGIGTPTRKKIILAHVDETFLLVKSTFKNLDELIWQDRERRKTRK